MANEIYTTTRDGLTALVSRHAADEVLLRAVTAEGSDPDRVDATLMSRLLRGRVRRSLERTLPRTGVRRVLAALDGRLAGIESTADASDPATTFASVSAESTPTAPVPGAQDPAAHDPAATNAAEQHPPSLDPIGPDAATTPRPQRDGAAEPPAALLDRLGELDAVRQWIWSADGRSAHGRGAGPDPERARRLLAPMWTILDRHGAVRSVHVHHGRGHVLVGRAPGATFAVAGDPDLNLGAIYAAFRALEEEP